ncbi:hypothetical protein Sjap_019058 [Stephania japonica]|uniref:Uncharacterized protein n=1 Tax=Stephania japonica TaxID=461633 RepID=A0AAP0HZC7_9MAGN
MALSVEKELEKQISEVANKLLAAAPSSLSAEELLRLLDQAEIYLRKVEQSPSVSMQAALYPLKKALIANYLLGHVNTDVKVAVASCISEITRISAPNAPYDDDQMKDTFQLLVSAFDGLFDMSSRSYSKRVSILETVAKVRSCVVMLDLECDGLILEMFEHFLRGIRDNHPSSVFSSMETILTLVLEESEEVAPGIVYLLLTCVKKDNKDILPAARRLGEKVLVNCAAKLKTYVLQAVTSLGLSTNDYSEAIASVCQEASSTVDQTPEEPMVDDDKDRLSGIGSDGTPQVAEAMMPEITSTKHDRVANSLQTSSARNVSAENVDAVRKSPNSVMNTSEKSLGHEPMKAEISKSATKLVKTETDSEQADEETRGKTDSRDMTQAQVNNVKETVEIPARSKLYHEKTNSALSEKCAGATAPLSVSNVLKSNTIASGRPAKIRPDGVPPKRGRPRKIPTKPVSVSGLPLVEGTLSTKSVGGVIPPSSSIASKDQHDGKNGSGAKLHVQSDGKEGTEKNKDDNTPSGKVGALKENPVQKNATGEQSATKEESEMKRVGRKSIIRKDVGGEHSDKKKASSIDSATKSVDKEHNHLDGTPKSHSKRKHTPEAKVMPDAGELLKEFDERVVSSKIKVWWPLDQSFYEGIISSYDPVTKKHKVSYCDGDEETLNLRMERWEFVGSDAALDEVQMSDLPNAHASEIKSKKKRRTGKENLQRLTMADRVVTVLIFINGSMVDGVNGVSYDSPPTTGVMVRNGIRLSELKATIYDVLSLDNQHSKINLVYRFPIMRNKDTITYVPLPLSSNHNLRLMFQVVCQLPQPNAVELFVEVVQRQKITQSLGVYLHRQREHVGMSTPMSLQYSSPITNDGARSTRDEALVSAVPGEDNPV